MPSSLQRAASALLVEKQGLTLEQFLRQRREPEASTPYWTIAQELRELTDGAVNVSGTTIQVWSRELLEVVESVNGGDAA